MFKFNYTKINLDKEYDVEVLIYNYNEDDVEKISIPSYYNGLPVTQLSSIKHIDEKYYGKFYIELILPYTLKQINCDFFNIYINELYIPSSVQKIDIFNLKLGKIKRIIIDSKNLYYKTIDNLLCSYDETILYGFSDEIGISHLVIPSTIEKITSFAFSYCDQIKSIDFSNSNLIEIEYNAFAHCKNLEKIILPSSLKMIGSDAFKDCEKVKTIFIPSSVEKIYSGAFVKCKNATIYCEAVSYNFRKKWHSDNVKVVYGVKKEDVLSAPYGLIENVISKVIDISYKKNSSNIKNDNTSISCSNHESKNNQKEKINNNQNIIVDNIDNNIVKLTINDFKYKINNEKKEVSVIKYLGNDSHVIIPDEITYIKEKYKVVIIDINCFEKCTFLEKIEFPKNLREILGYAFMGCIKLESVEFPRSLTFIDNFAFSSCINLKKAFLPSTLKYIEVLAFDFCEKLTFYTDSTYELEKWYFNFGCKKINYNFTFESYCKLNTERKTNRKVAKKELLSILDKESAHGMVGITVTGYDRNQFITKETIFEYNGMVCGLVDSHHNDDELIINKIKSVKNYYDLVEVFNLLLPRFSKVKILYNFTWDDEYYKYVNNNDFCFTKITGIKIDEDRMFEEDGYSQVIEYDEKYSDKELIYSKGW